MDRGMESRKERGRTDESDGRMNGRNGWIERGKVGGISKMLIPFTEGVDKVDRWMN